MKKAFRSIISMVVAFSVTAGGITYSNSVNADTAEKGWSASAITVPKEGQLVGAGYIDVEFDNSMDGYTYTVYLDGEPMYWNGKDIVKTEIGEKTTEKSEIKTFTSSDEGKTEVYTNTVSEHKITVKAEKDGKTIEAVRNFYVSKKGLALGGDMSDKISLSKLNCSWYYNWSTTAFNNSIDEGVAHVPMMWGGDDENKESIKNMTSTSNYILGFNEPDIKSQANMMFFEAANVWNECISPLKMRKVSPAPAAPGGNSRWLNEFMKGDYICKNPWDGSWGLYSDYEDDNTKTWVEGVKDVDAVVLHYYRNTIDLKGLLTAVETLWNNYHKPIWITEMSIFGIKGLDSDYSYEIPEKRAEMAKYVEGIVENLDKIPYVERYCWFPYNIQSDNDIDGYNGSGATAMFDYESGAYTELGRLYSNIGNPKGYEAKKIADDEMFVYVPETTTVAPTTESATVEPTTKYIVKPTEKVTKPAGKPPVNVAIPGKVKISGVKNIKKKSVKLVWKKVANAKKYQVQYSANKKFTKAVKTKTTTKLTYVVKKLKKNGRYYFRIRAVNGNKKGKWSLVKKAVIKK